MDSITPGTKKKFTLASPEGIGLVVLALGLGATAFMFAGQILPFVLTTLVLAFESVWVGLGLIASILFIGWLFKSKQLHLILWNVYKLAMRGFAGIFIEMDPIGMIKNRLEKMRSRKEDLEGSREDLKGQRVKLNREIEKTKAEIEQKFREAKAAHVRVADIASKAAAETDQVRKMQITLDAQQMDNEYKLALTEAGGKKETVEQKWLPLLNKMDQMDIILGKASIAADFIIRKTEIDIKKAETEWNVIRTANSSERKHFRQPLCFPGGHRAPALELFRWWDFPQASRDCSGLVDPGLHH